MSFLNPDSILKTIGIIQPGMKVGDFGCGAGYFSTAIARGVGEGGEVFAVDVQSSALEITQRKARAQGLENIEFIRADLERPGSTGISQGSLGAVLLATILFQSDKKREILEESKRLLEQNGRLIIIDWNPSSPMGPEGRKAPKEEIIELAKSVGFTLEREFNVDAYHYGLLFRS